MSGPVVIVGARGFVGHHLCARLAEAGVSVRGTSRHPQAAREQFPDVEWVQAEVDDPASLDAAFAGAERAVYLVHRMRAEVDDLEGTEARSARHVIDAADRAGLQRLVYLGGPQPSGEASHHLRARLRTGEVLRAGATSCVELRAGMVVGAGSESWLIVRDLALRLPVMVLPRWLSRRSEPIALDDVLLALHTALFLDDEGSQVYDLPGPEVLSGRQILERIAARVGIRTVMIPVPVLTPSLSSHWIRLVTRADYGVARQLVDGLTCDLVATGPTFWDRCPDLPRTSFDDAVRRALQEEPAGAMSALGRRVERLARVLSLPAR